MQNTEKVVVQLMVHADGALRTLDKFDSAMEGAANASVKAGAGVDAFNAQLARQRAAMEAGVPVMKARAAVMSAEERALNSVLGKADAVAKARIAAERDISRAVAATSNLVVQGKLAEADATRMLIAIEQQHAAVVDRAIADATRQAAANRVVAASRTYNAGAVRQNLVYQGQDIAVQLAGGQNPALIAMQQLPQILSGPGGANAALAETGKLAGMVVTRFGPLAAAIGLGAAAIGDMRDEINKTSNVTVGFGDVALAVWQSITAGIHQWIKPAVDLVGGWFGTAWEWVKDATKAAGNFIIRSIVGSIEYVKTSVASLPAAFTVAGESAAQALVDAITAGVNNVIGNLDSLIGGINGIAGQKVFDPIGQIEPFKVDIGGAQAAQDYANAWKDYANTMAALQERDIMGEWFADIQVRAIANATAGLEAVKGAANGAKDAAAGLGAALTDAAKAAQAEWEFYRGTFSGFFGDLRSGLMDGKSLWESFGNAASNALEKIADRLLNMASDSIFNVLFGAFGSIAGGAAMPIGGFIPGITGPRLFANGGVMQSPSLSAYSGGVFDTPQVFAFANGGAFPKAGVFGEAGPEAIMPLGRDGQGRLGVRVAANDNGGSSTSIVMHNTIQVPPGANEADGAEFARGFTREMKRQIPDFLEQHQRNPRRRYG